MGRIPIKVPLTPTLKHSIGATLLLLAFILYIYGVSAPVVRITVDFVVVYICSPCRLCGLSGLCPNRLPGRKASHLLCFVVADCRMTMVLRVLAKYQFVDVFSTIILKAMHLTKTFSNISAFLGDIAMPDVQSIGLLTCYFIANNIDFLGARLPGTPLSQPSGAVESLLWNMSGFWAMVALGLSASQVHRLAISFEDICQDMHALFLASTPELTAPMENSNILNCNSRSRRSRSPSLGLILHGCVRMAASVALLLPIWLKPTDILEVDIGLVNKHLQGFTDYVNPLLKEILPKTVGDCASAAHVAPQPCFGSMPLAFIRTKVYEATARWATGLNTTELLAVRFGAIPENRIMLTVTGKIKSLALSLRIGGCLYGEDPGRCPTIWDGTDGCCGDDIKFRLQMSVMCNSSFPYLADAILAPTHISKLVVKENILGIFPVEVADITQIVEDQLSEWARAFLDPHNKWIHWKDGETLSVISLLNVLLDINAPGGVRCPRV
ncbi:uncharacterized protein EMH_0047240 [Eimeria mitis]|uniref:Uncharacterized protein n=1 Tax=Eimeria mitis TaxID=44415 RepID=U6K775_9EIME|nr:uncharacterized protein EMH_0047240 [Eimeria mitis]CDJ32696.1 hypothetical protein, conserved [Eimeria mitis]